ncbi:MAG: AMP-binding protein, partial [Pseudomonadota bacterium]
MTGAVDFLIERFEDAGEKPAFIEADRTSTYADLRRAIAERIDRLDAAGIGEGTSVQLHGDFGLDAAAWLLALWSRDAIVSPVAPTSEEKAAE